MASQKRKKWSEAEEKTLIEKYGEMVADGTLAKMKTREKKFKPVAFYVNSVHHACDPVSYPWQWTWKDVSTKVQNMRHQYLLVKQKIRKTDGSAESSGIELDGDFDWFEGLTHWSNFLRYKEVFGDVPLSCNQNNVNNGSDLMVIGNEDREHGAGCVGEGKGMEIVEFGSMSHSCHADFAGMDGVENGVLCLGFDYDGDEAEENCDGNERLREEVDDAFACHDTEHKELNLKKKRKVLKGLEKKAFGFLATQLRQLRELEARFEQRDAERERERQKSENLRFEREEELERKLEDRVKEGEERENARGKQRRHLLKEWEALEKESQERLQRRREEEMIQEREWEDRMSRRRAEWKKRMDDRMSQHRAEMGQMQTRIIHEQQNLTSQLLGMLSQWTGHPGGLADHTNASSHYFSQMMQNLHHVNGLVHGDTRVDGDNQDDQFIVDG